MIEKPSFSLTRSVVIAARPATVFRYFTDSERFAAWWGKGSRIDPRPGGEVHICYPGGVTAGGTVVELAPDARIAFTYGYDDPAKPIARGASLVTVTVAEHPAGTLVSLVHDVPDETTRDEHVPGWRFQLSLFANVVANDAFRDVDLLIDRYFSAWNAPDAKTRADLLLEAVSENAPFHDAFACVEGRAELADHIQATKIHMPGLALRRAGTTRHCQGTALVDWIATGPDGATKARGTNVFTLSPGGLVAGVVGFWAPPD